MVLPTQQNMESNMSTHTYAVMKVSSATFEEIASKLKEAGYSQAFLKEGQVLNMHGIALEKADPNIPGRPIGSIGGLETP